MNSLENELREVNIEIRKIETEIESYNELIKKRTWDSYDLEVYFNREYLRVKIKNLEERRSMLAVQKIEQVKQIYELNAKMIYLEKLKQDQKVRIINLEIRT